MESALNDICPFWLNGCDAIEDQLPRKFQIRFGLSTELTCVLSGTFCCYESSPMARDWYGKTLPLACMEYPRRRLRYIRRFCLSDFVPVT